MFIGVHPWLSFLGCGFAALSLCGLKIWSLFVIQAIMGVPKQIVEKLKPRILSRQQSEIVEATNDLRVLKEAVTSYSQKTSSKIAHKATF